ncbi:MAG: TolC family protein [Epsilonproteobacteria bacterium]|nr:TolC family protein [Campylobacterota bacterium]
MNKILIAAAPLMVMASTVTFDEALQQTFANNNELKAKKLNISLAREDLSKAKSYDFGHLYLSEDISRTNNALYVFGNKLESREATFLDFGADQFTGPAAITVAPDKLNNPEARTNYKTKVVYEFPLFTGFKIQYAKEIAKLQIKAKEYKYNRDKNTLAVEVLKAYNGAVAAKYFIKALQSAKQTTTSFVNMTQNLYSQGIIVKSDVLSAKSRDSQVDAKLIEAKNKYNLALAYLRFLTGNNDITGVKDFKVIVSPNSNLDTLKQQALNNRNDIKWMQQNVKTMQKKVKMDSSIKYPTAGVHLEYGFNDDRLTTDKDKDYYLLAANITYNFLDAGKTEELAKSKIQSHQTSLYFAHMKNGIKVDVEQKLLNLQAKTAIIKVKIKNKDLANAVLNQYKEMYKNGLINIAILLMKQADAQKADAELIKAKYDQAIASAELELAVGNPILREKK